MSVLSFSQIWMWMQLFRKLTPKLEEICVCVVCMWVGLFYVLLKSKWPQKDRNIWQFDIVVTFRWPSQEKLFWLFLFLKKNLKIKACIYIKNKKLKERRLRLCYVTVKVMLRRLRLWLGLGGDGANCCINNHDSGRKTN